MRQLEEYLSLLVSHDQEPDYQDLVAKLTAHHKEYYTVKWATAQEDVVAFFSPVWLSSLENAYLWVTGWKPSMVFRLIDSLRRTRAGLVDLTEEQMRRIEVLRGKIKGEEMKVERDMERQQVSMADRRMVELARLSSGVKKAEAAAEVDGLVEAAFKVLSVGLERVMKMADCVRLKTLKGVLDLMSPKQSVDLLSATSLLQIQLRKWGRKREERVSKIENSCLT